MLRFRLFLTMTWDLAYLITHMPTAVPLRSEFVVRLLSSPMLGRSPGVRKLEMFLLAFQMN